MRIPPRPYMLVQAAMINDLDLVKYFHELTASYARRALKIAAVRRFMDIVRYLGTRVSQQDRSKAIKRSVHLTHMGRNEVTSVIQGNIANDQDLCQMQQIIGILSRH